MNKVRTSRKQKQRVTHRSTLRSQAYHRVLLLTGFILIGLLMFLFIRSASTDVKAGQTSTQSPSIHHLDTSWQKTYRDIKTLKHDADVIASGTISSVKGTTTQKLIHKASIPFTDFTFTLKKVIWDPHQIVNTSTLTIHQTGGTVNNTVFEVDDDPLFHVGEQTILVLHQFAPGQYYVIGGPTGRFEVNNGQVTPMSQEGITFKALKNEEAFVTDIQNA